MLFLWVAGFETYCLDRNQKSREGRGDKGSKVRRITEMWKSMKDYHKHEKRREEVEVINKKEENVLKK